MSTPESICSILFRNTTIWDESNFTFFSNDFLFSDFTKTIRLQMIAYLTYSIKMFTKYTKAFCRCTWYKLENDIWINLIVTVIHFVRCLISSVWLVRLHQRSFRIRFAYHPDDDIRGTVLFNSLVRQIVLSDESPKNLCNYFLHLDMVIHLAVTTSFWFRWVASGIREQIWMTFRLFPSPFYHRHLDDLS